MGLLSLVLGVASVGDVVAASLPLLIFGSSYWPLSPPLGNSPLPLRESRAYLW